MSIEEYRKTPEYKQRKLAYELVSSPYWTEYLEPKLNKPPVKMVTAFGSLQDLTDAMNTASKRNALASLKATIENEAKKFIEEV